MGDGSGWGQWGSASVHERYVAPSRPRSRKRCHCGCGSRATHLGMANGVALTTGCEWQCRLWARNGEGVRNAR